MEKFRFIYLISKSTAMMNNQTTNNGNKDRRGFAASVKKLNHNIDMTPMVDVVFLLITFFLYTATMSEPNTMNLYMPEDGPNQKVALSGAMNIIIGSDDKIYYYEGALKNGGGNVIQSDMHNIRSEIIRKKKEVIMNYRPDAAYEKKQYDRGATDDDIRQKNLTILIKPTAEATYQNIVSVLDEMAISKIARYAIVEPEKEELAYIR